jgi:hypothetical protein
MGRDQYAELISALTSLEQRKAIAWAKTRPLGLLGYSHPPEARMDEQGNIIYLSHYGRRDSEYGWEIDHRVPSALGGPDNGSNWRALHWRANCVHGGLLGALLRKLG